MLYLVGLGLGDPQDITVKGLEIVKKCEHVYLEAYTSVLSAGPEELSKFYGKEVIVADREMVEQGADGILERAKSESVAFLVVGDPFGATTHTDLVLRARTLNVPVEVVHNASIMNAIGACGLQLYSFGETVSIPFWTDTWEPDSFFDKIRENKKRGLHTLCLLVSNDGAPVVFADIKVKEPNLEAMMRGKVKYDPPRFMTAAQAADQLVRIVDKRPDEDAVLRTTPVVAVARIGSPSQKIISCTLEALVTQDLGPPLHSLVICGNMHPLEEDFLASFTNTDNISTT